MRSPASCIVLLTCAAAFGQSIDALWESPAIDRWMYPFNGTPGTRSALSVFGSDFQNPALFDARDGQILLAFDTADQVPTGSGLDGWRVVEAEVTLQVQNDLVFRYDPTADPWTDFLPTSDPRRTVDADAGQPVELGAVGFRNGWTAGTFQETSPFAEPGDSFLSPSVRNAFAAVLDPQGVPVDASNHPREGWQPSFLAVGRIDGLSAGERVPGESLMRFRMDLALPGVQAWLRQGLSQGRVFLSVSSLTSVQQQAGDFPVFYARENAFVQLGLSEAASLRLRLEREPACRFADLDCNGAVDAGDISVLLVQFGCSDCPGDLDGNGIVDAGDISVLLVNFG
jgi:hypothetical protein